MSAAIRIAGVNIPPNKHIIIGLRAVYGIGATRAQQICDKAGVKTDTKGRDLTQEQQEALRKEAEIYDLEGDLRREVTMNIKQLIDIGCYRGHRHKRGLPLRGQRTRTNARTRKGKKKGASGIKKD